MAFGFVVARFGLFLRELARVGGPAPTQRFDSALVGSFVVVTGVAVNVWASFRHRVIVRSLHQGTHQIGATGPIAIGLASGIGGPDPDRRHPGRAVEVSVRPSRMSTLTNRFDAFTRERFHSGGWRIRR